MAPKRTREDPDAKEQKSLLSSAAEISFPRGGASVLTPIEMKEVANQAKSDVLFESQAKSDLSEPSKKKAKKSKKSKVSLLNKDEENEEEKAKKITIDTLSYNILNPGSYVLGMIKQINKMEIIMALADNLVGFVPITNISSELVKLLHEYDDQEESDSDSDNEESSSRETERQFPSLSNRFKVGQYLRAKVVSNINDKGKKRIELSIEPEKVNSPMEEKEDLVENAIVQASVTSIEDHGAILNFGKNTHLSGFISKKELDSTASVVQAGSVLLVSISKINSRTATCKFPVAVVKKQPIVAAVSSIDALLPGMLVDAIIEGVLPQGLTCKVHSLCDATITLQHMNSLLSPDEIKHNYSVGSVLKARIIATYTKNGTTKLAISILPNHQTLTYTGKDALEAFPIGHIFDTVTIRGKSPNFLFVDVMSGEIPAQVHNSRVTKGKDLDLNYKIGSTHQARVLDYSMFDNYYILTMDKEQIDASFIKATEIPVGQKVTCKVEKVSPEGIIVNLENNFQATVPDIHISDIKLVYPERKFKIGASVKGRVLNVRAYGSKSFITVTLKRSLVNADDEEIVTSYDMLDIGKKVPATVQKILPSGCVVSFFGNVSAFLPNAEISETYVRNANDFVKVGQTVKVRVISVDKALSKCMVSLRVSSDMTDEQVNALSKLVPGKSIVNAEVLEKERDSVIVKLDDCEVRGIVHVGHLADGLPDVARSQLKKLKIGEKIEALVLVLDKRHRAVTLSCKPSLLSDAKAGSLPTEFTDISISDKVLHGYVKTVIPTGVFVSFGNNLTGLVIPRFASGKKINDLTAAFTPDQSVNCSVVNVDQNSQRFLLSLLVGSNDSKENIINPVDKSVKKLGDYSVGKVTKCIIKSIENTHLLVKLADNQEGIVDITQTFDDIKRVENLAEPLSSFTVGKKLEARVIGYFDVEKQKFLHSKKDKSNLIELSIRPSVLKSKEVVYPLSFHDIKEGQSVTGYISSINNGYFWYHISASQKAKLSFIDVTDDVSKFENFKENYKVGAVVPAKVTNINTEHYAITVSGRFNNVVSGKDIKVGDVLPSLVLNVRGNSVLVSLGNNVTAVSMATDALDDYTLHLEDVYHIGDLPVATVVSTEGKIYVSLRGKNPKDKLINSIADIKRGDVVRGYINKINNTGLFVDLGRSVYALVKVSDISDSFIKDWKKDFHINQPVRGRILEADSEGRVLMTLKDSVVNGEISNLKSFKDLKVGDIFEGSIKKVEEYGVFVKLDGTENISGLCHRSEITDSPIKDAQEIFKAGERVKVKILDINSNKRQLSLGMKASYFKNADSDIDEDGDVIMEKASDNEDSDDEEMIDADSVSSDSEEDSHLQSDEEEKEEVAKETPNGLSAGFDWTASILEQAKEEESSDEEEDFNNEVNRKAKKQSKKSKSEETEDKTGDLNTRAPQSVSDFERLLVGNPDSSILWIQYMSFQLQLSEIEKAREIAERALKTINFREEQQKMNIWIALLNLENSFGDDESLKDVFKRACQYMDSFTMHQKLATIYIASEKYRKADELLAVLCKKFGSKQPSAWVTYGSFLIDRRQNEEAHKILAKALQILPKREHVDVVRKFAQLEFQKGDPEQGRSLFEGLLSDVPKRIDIWNVYIDQEIKANEKSKVDDLFERVVERKLSRKQAKFFFAKWLSFEESQNDEKAQDYVKANAAEYAQKLSK